MIEPDPVGIVEHCGAAEHVGEPVRFVEMVRHSFHATLERVRAVHRVRERPHAIAAVEQTLGDVPAGVTKRSGHDVQLQVGHEVPFVQVEEVELAPYSEPQRNPVRNHFRGFLWRGRTGIAGGIAGQQHEWKPLARAYLSREQAELSSVCLFCLQKLCVKFLCQDTSGCRKRGFAAGGRW